MKKDFGIDAVITWVDGKDKKHLKKRLDAMSRLGLLDSNAHNATYETRFNDSGEIYYCIASILKYAPFIRTIFIVTDNQEPPYINLFSEQEICTRDKIKIVDHTVIFKGLEDCLPTFNSLSIESLLWLIPGISEYFLYFNDDFFINAPISQQVLIDHTGKLQLHGKMRSIWPLKLKFRVRNLRYRLLRRNNIPAHFKTAQVLSAQLAGLTQYLQLGHTPHIIRTETLNSFFEEHHELLRDQVCYPFRSIKQFLPVGLANHLEIKNNNARILPEEPSIYMKPNTPEDDSFSLEQMLKEEYKYGCIQSLDEFTPDRLDQVRKTMRKKLADYLPEFNECNKE
jgi:hypothetical protein